MKIDTVLFDIGGVLTPDPYENIILHEQRGIGRHLGITESQLVSRVKPIWDKYAILPNAKESDFWDEIKAELGIAVSDEEIDKIKNEIIEVNSEAVKVFALLRNSYKIGVVSNTTSFFYKFQTKRTSLLDYADPNLIFTSSKDGLTKENGLFNLVAKSTNPSSTLVIDDRESNVAKAEKAGFIAVRYSMNESSLMKLIKELSLI